MNVRRGSIKVPIEVKRPNGDPSSIVRVQLTCIFPSGEQ